MIIYHGSTDTIKLPLAKVGRPDLDFGQGFYTTDILDQAKLWADRMHRQRHELDFIAACRTGIPLWKDYDCIEGGIANDRVIDTVEAYIAGNMDAEHALEELSKHRPNNQICIISQRLIDDCLKYKETELC